MQHSEESSAVNNAQSTKEGEWGLHRPPEGLQPRLDASVAATAGAEGWSTGIVCQPIFVVGQLDGFENVFHPYFIKAARSAGARRAAARSAGF